MQFHSTILFLYTLVKKSKSQDCEHYGTRLYRVWPAFALMKALQRECIHRSSLWKCACGIWVHSWTSAWQRAATVCLGAQQRHAARAHPRHALLEPCRGRAKAKAARGCCSPPHLGPSIWPGEVDLDSSLKTTRRPVHLQWTVAHSRRRRRCCWVKTGPT